MWKLLALCLLTGCISKPRPVLNVYGEGGYIYTKIGLMWGNPENRRKWEQEDFMFGRGDGNGGRSSRSSGGCSSGRCSPK